MEGSEPRTSSTARAADRPGSPALAPVASPSFEEAIQSPGTRRWSLTPVIAQRELAAAAGECPQPPIGTYASSSAFPLRERWSSMSMYHETNIPTSPRWIHPFGYRRRTSNPSDLASERKRSAGRWRPASSLSFHNDRGGSSSDVLSPILPPVAFSETQSHGLGFQTGATLKSSSSLAMVGERAVSAQSHIQETHLPTQSPTMQVPRIVHPPVTEHGALNPTLYHDPRQTDPSQVTSSYPTPTHAQKRALPPLTGLQALPMLGGALDAPIRPSTSSRLPKTERPTITRPASSIAISSPPSSFQETDLHPEVYAEKCWANDVTWLGEGVAQWLGGSLEIQAQARRLYMARFSFEKLSLDEALRRLCTQIFLRAEAQQIDRILAEFSKRYSDCNPAHQLGSADAIYTVSFALLLLNTDLHGERSEKMSRAQFVRNTLTTLASLRSPLPSSTSLPSQDSDFPDDEVGEEENIRSWHTQTAPFLREMYNRIRADPLGGLSHVSSFSSLRRIRLRSRQGSLLPEKPSGSLPKISRSKLKSSASIPQIHLEVLPTMRGYMAHTDLGAKRRFRKPSTTVYWALVHKGVLALYKTDQGPYLDTLEPESAYLQFSLVHAVAEKSSTGHVPHNAFDLMLPDCVQHRFQVSEDAQVQSWIDTIHCHAAQYSRIPLQGSEGNVDFGWSKLDHQPVQPPGTPRRWPWGRFFFPANRPV